MATITNSLSTSGIPVVLQSQGGALSIGTAANATVITIGNVTGASAVNINSGSAGSVITTTNGVFTVKSGTGAIQISNDATNTTVGIATGAGAKLLTLGSTSGASSVTINTGSAGVSIPSFSSYGALVSNTSGLITDAASTANFVLTGNSGSAPTFQSVSASGAVIELTADSGSASPASGIIDIAGGSNINTSGATNVLTINLNNSPSVSGTITAGTGVVATTGGLTATAGGLTVTAGTVTITPFANTGALVTNASGVITDANANTSGYVLTSNGSGSVPSFQAPAASGFVWANTTGATQAMAVSTGYVSNDGVTLVTFTLPSTAAVGAEVAVVGSGAGLWTIAQNAGQTIHFNAVDSTTGVTGSVSSTSRYDSITLICNVANSDWVVYQATGNLSVV